MGLTEADLIAPGDPPCPNAPVRLAGRLAAGKTIEEHK
jgi:hypothetical protein